MTAWSCPSGAPRMLEAASEAVMPGHTDDVDVIEVCEQVERRAGHRVEPGVAGADERHGPALPRGLTASRARASSLPSPVARTSVPGRRRSRIWSRYWSSPMTTDARRSSATARGGEEVARAGTEADEGQAASGSEAGYGGGGHGGRITGWAGLVFGTSKSASSAGSARRSGGGLGDAKVVPTSASATSRYGFGTSDLRPRCSAGWRTMASRVSGRLQDARLVSLRVYRGQAGDRCRAQPAAASARSTASRPRRP